MVLTIRTLQLGMFVWIMAKVMCNVGACIPLNASTGRLISLPAVG